MPARVVVIIPRLARRALPTTRARGRAPNTALAFAACILVVRRRVTRTRVPRRSRLVIGDRPPPHPRRRCRWMGTGGPSREGARGGDYTTGHDPSRGDRSPRPTTRQRVMCGSGPCVLYRGTRSVSMYYYFVFSRACVGARTPVMRSIGRDGPVRTVVGVKPIYVWVDRSVASRRSVDRSIGRSVGRSRRSVGRSRHRRHTRARVDRPTVRPRATDDRAPRARPTTTTTTSRPRPTLATDARDRPTFATDGDGERVDRRGVSAAPREVGVPRDTFVSQESSHGRRSRVDSVNRRDDPGWIR